MPFHSKKYYFLKTCLFITTSLFFSFQTLYAQTETVDSLTKILPSLRDIARINCLNELGFEYSNPYFSKSKYVRTDSALFYALQAQKESQQLNYARGIGMAFQNLASVEDEYGDYIKSEKYTQLAIPIFEKENIQTELNIAKINLANCLQHQGKYNKAIEILQKELPYYESVKDTEHVAMIFIMIGLNQSSLGYSEKAFEYFEKSFNIQKKAGDLVSILYSPERRAELYLGTGDTAKALLYYYQIVEHTDEHHIILDYSNVVMSTIYMLQKQYDSALFCLKQNILFIQSSNTDSLFKKRELMLDGMDMLPLYLLLNDFDSVIKYGAEPLKKFANDGDIYNMMPVLRDITKAYIMKSEYEKALYYAKQLVTYGKKTDARPFIKDGYLSLSNIFAAQHKIDLAYKYRLLYNTLNDSLQKDNYASRLAAFDVITEMNTEEANYKSQLKINEEKNDAKVRLVNKEKQLQLYVSISTILTVLLLAIGFARNIILKRKKDHLQLAIAEANNRIEKQKQEQEVAQLQQQKTELEVQALRAQMNPHFIFNCLSSVNRFILTSRTEEASDYLTKFSRLIRMALHNSEKPYITLENELEALRLYLELEKLRFKNAFDFSISLVNTIDVAAVFIPPMLLQPFIENAIWHGLMHLPDRPAGKQDAGFLDIALSIEEKILTCIITDNGIGRSKASMINSKSAEKNKSMGVKITADRLALLSRNEDERAVFTIEDLTDKEGNAAGTKVILKMKYLKLAEAFENQNQ